MAVPLAQMFLPLELQSDITSIDYGLFFQVIRRALPAGKQRSRGVPHLLQLPHDTIGYSTSPLKEHLCRRCKTPLLYTSHHINRHEYSALLKAGGPSPLRILVIVGSVQDLIATPISRGTFGMSKVVKDLTLTLSTCHHPSLVPLTRVFSFILVESVKSQDYEFLLRCKMAECPGLTLEESSLLVNKVVDLALIESLNTQRGMINFGLTWGGQAVKLGDVSINPIQTWTASDADTSEWRIPREGCIPYVVEEA